MDICVYLKFCFGCLLAYNAAFLGYISYCLFEVIKREIQIRKDEKKSPK